uniref:ACT domain-containing protein n=1 Tax=Physcomitrium patens TaxID=3218 RepID=A0A7I4C831_PHYPA
MVANICDILLVDETRERRVDVASDGPPSLLLSYDSESLGRDGSVTLPITFQTGSDNREFLKRAHDVGAFESFEDRRRKSAKLDEQLECLQSVLPCSTKVEVVKRDGLLEVCIVCVNRPGLLVDVMSAVESRSFDVVQVRIACHDDIVVEYLSLESEDSLSSYSAEVEKDITSEEDSVKTMFVHAICKEGFDCVL